MVRGTFRHQFWALTKKNFLVKVRNRKRFVLECLLPLYMVLILYFINLAVKPTSYPAELDPPTETLSSFAIQNPGVLGFSCTNADASLCDEIQVTTIEFLLASWNIIPKPKFFSSPTDMDNFYVANEGLFWAGVIINNTERNPPSFQYVIRMQNGGNYSVPASQNVYETSVSDCR
ncbi:MAG: hypothetical protein F2825_03180 [Actinobacteria bacterium]|nr:hypothetical protein [Actinomycetota bacterium]